MSCKYYHAEHNFLGKIGVCWGTKECEACSCDGDEAKCNFYDYVRERVKKPTTNADCIRAMSDEELAEWIHKRDCHTNYYGYDPKDAVLDWLKQEVKE